MLKILFPPLICAFLMACSGPSASEDTSADAPAEKAGTATSAVILTYHRFGDSRYPSTNIRMDQFRAHLKAIQDGGYEVVRIDRLLQAMAQGQALPQKTVAITIDDAYASVFAKARPLLKQAGLPYAVFVATNPHDKGFADMMSWDQLRTLQDEGVYIGAHSASHLHMLRAGDEAIRADLEKSSQRFEDELGSAPDIFAYPYGEFDPRVKALVQEAGYDFALAQYSAPLRTAGDLYEVPRFALNENYGDMGRVRTILSSRALPVEDITPSTPHPSQSPAQLTLTLARDVEGLKAMRCFPSGMGAVEPEIDGLKITIALPQPFTAGRNRINCTFQAQDGSGGWYWFGWPVFLDGGGRD